MTLTTADSHQIPAAFKDYRCLVIGAASGIGAALTTSLTAQGAQVVAADLPSARWSAELGFRVPIDVADPASMSAAVVSAVDHLSRLDAVVNCAGILGKVQPSQEESVADFERLLAVNLTGAFLLSQAVLPIMAAQGFGRLVHMSSTAGKEGVAQMTGYSASKAGILGLVKALGKEYAKSGVTVNAVAPGSIDTPLIAGMSDQRREAQKRLIPMGRLGRPDEVASLIEYVISPQAAFVTGFVFDLSGGRATY